MLQFLLVHHSEARTSRHRDEHNVRQVREDTRVQSSQVHCVRGSQRKPHDGAAHGRPEKRPAA